MRPGPPAHAQPLGGQWGAVQVGEHSAPNVALKTQCDFTRTWDVTLKATDGQTRQTNKEKVTQVDYSVVVAGGEGAGSEG